MQEKFEESLKKAKINCGKFCNELKKHIDRNDLEKISEICSFIDEETINARKLEYRSNSYMDYNLEKETLLEYALTQRKPVGILKTLLNAKAKPTPRHSGKHANFENAISLAISSYPDDKGVKEVVELLLNYGANINGKNSEGKRPIEDAVRKFPGYINYLIEKGAYIYVQDRFRRTPLHRFAESKSHPYHRQPELWNALLARDIINLRNYFGSTALHDAVAQSNYALVNELLLKGADCTIKDNDGRMPMDLINEKGDQEAVALIRERLSAIRKMDDSIADNPASFFSAGAGAGTGASSLDPDTRMSP